MTRKRPSFWQRVAQVLRDMWAVDDPVRRRRSDGARRGWQTRKRKSMAVKVSDGALDPRE